MPVTYKRQDDLEKLLGEFASFEALDQLTAEIEPEKKEKED